MMEIPIIRTVGEWLLAMGNYVEWHKGDKAAREADKRPHHQKFLSGELGGVTIDENGQAVLREDFGYDPAGAEIRLRAGAADFAAGIPELRALAEAEGEIAVTIPWVRKYRGLLVQAGAASAAAVDAMTLVEFGEAIRRLNASGNRQPRLTPTDEMILRIIDKHGRVESQSDLLDKLSKAGEVAEIGTVKPRLAELKANGTLVAWKGTRGYMRPA